MAASPEWKVYDSHGVYQAACKEVEAAAALMGFYGAGSTIRHGHSLVVWTEPTDSGAASCDDIAATAYAVVAAVTNNRKQAAEAVH